MTTTTTTFYTVVNIFCFSMFPVSLFNKTKWMLSFSPTEPLNSAVFISESTFVCCSCRSWCCSRVFPSELWLRLYCWFDADLHLICMYLIYKHCYVLGLFTSGYVLMRKHESRLRVKAVCDVCCLHKASEQTVERRFLVALLFHGPE